MSGEGPIQRRPGEVFAVPPEGWGGGDTSPAAVYVHAPFCARRCVYCDFAVTVARAPDPAPWLEALGAELELLDRVGLAPAPRLDTLYVGGGTPSLLGPGAMQGLAALLGGDRLATVEEWTVEANPESITPELAEAWREAGVNRVSLGVQSFREEVLRWMGRLHGAAGARRAVRILTDAGVENIGVDLIFGLPRRLERDWRRELDEVIELGPPHVSLYGLTAEAGTALGRAVARGDESLADAEEYRKEYLEASHRLGAAGYEHYEVSNFALPGRRSRHNPVYWSGRPWLGLGNSAHSFVGGERRWNLRDWEAYRRAVLGGVLPLEGSERVEGEAARLEWIWLSLRSDQGIPRSLLPGEAARLVAEWEACGWTRPDPRRLILSAEGWLVLDRLAVELDHRWGGTLAGPHGTDPASSGRGVPS